MARLLDEADHVGSQLFDSVRAPATGLVGEIVASLIGHPHAEPRRRQVWVWQLLPAWLGQPASRPWVSFHDAMLYSRELFAFLVARPVDAINTPML